MSVLDLNSPRENCAQSFWIASPIIPRIISMPIILQDTLYLKSRNSLMKKHEFILTEKCIYYRTPLISMIRAKLTWSLIDSFYESTEESVKFGFSISNNQGSQDFYTDSAGTLEKWLDKLALICIMTSFDQDFVIIKDIDSGRFGTVSLCQDLNTGFEYAVKKVNKKELLEISKIEHLRNEIKILKKINHGNCIKAYRVYEDIDSVLLVMEYIAHGTLLQRMQKVRCFSEDEASALIKNLINLANYLHSSGIIHRDIKLENILMTSSTNNYEFKLGDFGLATYNKKFHNSKCGSPGFMAPEILNGETYCSKCDIFSIGVICYILLAGKPPFSSKNLKVTIEKNKECRTKFDGKKWKRVSNTAVNFVKGLLSKDPLLRPSADQVQMHPWINKLTKSDSEYPIIIQSTIEPNKSLNNS